MKKSELIKDIREEIKKQINEISDLDTINRSLNILDKTADMIIKNPTGNIIEVAKIIKKNIEIIRKSL